MLMVTIFAIRSRCTALQPHCRRPVRAVACHEHGHPPLTDDIKDRAEAKFKKEERASEAMTEYNAAREAERAKTERLRALRLAKEAAGKKK
jgi:hypothetical protein